MIELSDVDYSATLIYVFINFSSIIIIYSRFINFLSFNSVATFSCTLGVIYDSVA